MRKHPVQDPSSLRLTCDDENDESYDGPPFSDVARVAGIGSGGIAGHGVGLVCLEGEQQSWDQTTDSRFSYTDAERKHQQ